MKNLVKLVFFNGIVLVFMGCGGSYSITYNTKPSCAMLMCDGEYKGATPITLEYDKDRIDKNGILRTQQCKAVFVSGWEANFKNRIDTNKFPDGFKNTIKRPQGVGYSQDWDFVCSDTCTYAQAMNFFGKYMKVYHHQGKTLDDVFLELKRSNRFMGLCP